MKRLYEFMIFPYTNDGFWKIAVSNFLDCANKIPDTSSVLRLQIHYAFMLVA